MGRFYLPTQDAEEWRKFLAAEKQWKTGYSAKALAFCWQEANGFPPEVISLFANTGHIAFQDIEFLCGFPEHQVSLPGGSRPSQNDLFVLARAQTQLISITIEGKVSEPFGPTLIQWVKDNSKGKEIRLTYLLEQLSLKQPLPPTIRYQLLHRAASAVIEANRFNASTAAMIVHSFRKKDENDWFSDYRDFLALFNVKGAPNNLQYLCETQGVDLYCGWVQGDARFLEM